MSRTAVAVRHVAFEDLGLIAPLLTRRGYETSYLEAGVDPFDPVAIVDPDLLVVLGGPIGVYDSASYPFLDAEKTALAARVRSGRPTLGICLGAQLLADVLGAEVTATGRHEIGYAPLTLTEAGTRSVLAPLAGTSVLHWHGDAFSIPSGAQRLAETPGFPNQAFSVGTTLALQFHLEADPAQLERWLIGHAHELATVGADPASIRADAAEYGPPLAEAAGVVLSAWLDQVEAGS